MTINSGRNEKGAGKREGSMPLSKLAIIFAAVIMLSVCVAVPLAEMHNEDNAAAGDHRAPAGSEIPIDSEFKLRAVGTGAIIDGYTYSLSAEYILTDDILLTATDVFKPIGYAANNTTVNPFTGSFDGNGYVIDGMNVGAYNGTNYYQYAGLFAQLGTNAKISNVGLINSSVTSIGTAFPYAGGIVGRILDTTTGAKITNCYNTGSVSASTESLLLVVRVGGIAGGVVGTIITNCYNTGSVSASSSTAIVHAGGIAGTNTGTITNCYNTGSVAALSITSNAGGIIGFDISGTPTNCYNTGSIFALGNFGGIIGDGIGTIDDETCLYLEDCAPGGNLMGTLMTAAQLRMESTYPTTGITNPWNFTDVWTFSNAGARNNGLPYFIDINDPRIFITGGTGDVVISSGEKKNQYFSVSAISDIELTFKWQISIDSGVTWEDDFRAGGKSTGNLSVSPLNYSQGAMFRCIISNSRTEVISETMTLSVDPSTPTVHFVENEIQLQWVGDGNDHGDGIWSMGDTYIQTADILFNAPASGMSNFIPLPMFGGTYDGNGFTISGMVIATYDGTNYYSEAGLFSQLGVEATVLNVGMINCSIKAESSSGDTYAGGIVACIPYATDGIRITNCYNTGPVSAGSDGVAYAGGIAGYVGGMNIITNCYNTGPVSATSAGYAVLAGGITGYIYEGGIISCYNTGPVSAAASSSTDAYAGGIAGHNEAMITSCYNTGPVSAVSDDVAYAGGIAGYVDERGIARSYNTGPVSTTGSGTNNFGGVVGFIYSGTIDDASCFYLDTCVTSPTNTNGTSKSDGELRMGSTYPDTGTYPWDFENTWFFSPIDGYFMPHLKAFVPQMCIHPPAAATTSNKVHVMPYPSVFAQAYGWQKYSAVNGWEDFTNPGPDPFVLSLASSVVGDRYRFFIEYGNLGSTDPVRRTISLEVTVEAMIFYDVDASVSYRTEASGSATEGYGHIIRGGNYSVEKGSDIEFDFEAEGGYVLTDVFVKRQSVFESVFGDVLNNKYRITSVSENITIVAEFSKLIDLTVAVNGLDGSDNIIMKYVVNGTEHNSITPGTIKVPLDVEVTIFFQYGGSKLFQRWGGYASGLESIITFDTPVVAGNIAVTAYFLPPGTPTLTLNYDNGGTPPDGTVGYVLYKSGTDVASGNIPFTSGMFTFPMESTDTINLTANGGTNDIFQVWSDVPNADPFDPIILGFAISSTSAITAYFVDSLSETMTINYEGPNGDGTVGYILNKNGTDVASGNIPFASGTFSFLMASTDTITLTAVDGTDDLFQRWADDIIGVTSNLSTIDRPINASVASGSVSVTVYFVDASLSELLTLNYSGVSNDGAVLYVLSKNGTAVASGQITFTGNVFRIPMELTDTIDLTTVNGSDDIFQRWTDPSGEYNTTLSSIAVSDMTGPLDITACFVSDIGRSDVKITYMGIAGGEVWYGFGTSHEGMIQFTNGVAYIVLGAGEDVILSAENGTVRFFRWTDNIGSTYSLSAKEITVSGTADIAANFANFSVETLRITAYADSNSMISPDGTNIVSRGDTTAFTFSAKPGYRISKVIVDGSEVQASGTYTFTDVRSSHTISVFSEKEEGRSFTVAVDYDRGLGYIEISINGSQFTRYDGTMTVTEGSSVVLRAVPGEDSSFRGWTGTIRSLDQELRISNVSENISERADFSDNGGSLLLWIAIIIIAIIAVIIIAFFLMRSARSKD